MSFAGKVVIVTGSSSGIGAATAIAFAQEGANVVIVGRKEDKLIRVRDECAKTGNEPLLMKADVSKDDDAKRIVNETVAKFGKIDVLVNNAGVIHYGGILDDDVMEAYDWIMNTNLRAQVHITHLAAPYLIKTKGNIINISSVSGKMTFKDSVYVSYATSKAALDHFTRLVAAELAKFGVRVNAISPGPVRTDIFSNGGEPDKDMETAKDIVALGRVSDPEEIADLTLFLASDKARAITGSDYLTDNGMLLKN